MIQETDARGRVKRYEYDSDDNLIAESDLVETGTPRRTTLTYDAYHRVTSTTLPDGGQVSVDWVVAGPATVTKKLSSTEDATTAMTYWPTGKLKTLTDPLGRVTSFEYDGHGDLISVAGPLTPTTTYTYYEDGRLKTVKNEALDQTTTFFYNAAGRFWKVQRPDGAVVTYEYDLGGRRTRVTDAAGRTTTTIYDRYGRIQDVLDPSGGRTQFTYDSMSNVTSIKDAAGRTTRYEYDGYRHVTKTIFPDSREELFEYDDAGRLVSRTDRRKVVTGYQYDAAERVSVKTYSNGNAPLGVEYDAMDRLTKASNGWDNVTLTYDLGGRLTSERSDANGSLLEYRYYADGRRKEVLLEGATLASYALDVAGRKETITAGGDVFGVTYDAGWRSSAVEYPYQRRSFSYDGVGRLLQVRNTDVAGTMLASTLYGYIGLRVDPTTQARTSPDNRYTKTTDEIVETYGYDWLDRLVSVERSGAEPGTSLYGYDGIGNRLDLAGAPAAAVDAGYEYDPNGNLAAKVENGNRWTYRWDVENRLTQVLKNGAEVARFRYDPLGRRVSKGVGGSTTQFLYDGLEILRETRSDGTMYTYVHGPTIDEHFARVDQTGAKQYYLSDGLGSIVKLVGPANQVIVSRRYDAWGNLQVGADESGYAFTGREWDAETGLYYYRARYYDPKIGRFISEDPIGFLGGDANLFAYVSNNPISYTDPFGLLRWNNPPPRTVPVTGQTLANIQCVETCLRGASGSPNLDLLLTGGAEQTGHGRSAAQGGTSHHYRGEACDIGGSNPVRTNDVMSCASQCGFGAGQYEQFPNEASRNHWHLQLTPGNGVPAIPPNPRP